MNKNYSTSGELPNFLPYLFLGIGLALLTWVIINLSYVIFWGASIGFVLWIIAALKEKFFPKSRMSREHHKVIRVEENGSVIVEDEVFTSHPKKEKGKKKQ